MTITTSCAPARIGDVAFVARFEGEYSHGPYLAIRCGCGDLHHVAIAPFSFSNGASWTFTSRAPVHMEPSLVVDVPGMQNARCHLFVHNGELQMLDDTTRPLK